jgi:hypothetical protein
VVLRKTDSYQGLDGAESKHERRRKTSADNHPQINGTSALQAYQSSLASSAAAAAAAGSGIGLGMDDYVIHPHDRARVAPSASGGRGSSALAQARRSTAERLLGDKGHKRSGSYGDSPDKGNAAFLEGSVITTSRNSRCVGVTLESLSDCCRCFTHTPVGGLGPVDKHQTTTRATSVAACLPT